MNKHQEMIFNGFKLTVIDKMDDYFSSLGFNIELPFKIESQWISKSYLKKKNEINLSLSLHHLDYADGIQVGIKTEFGEKHLLSEIQKKSKTKIPVYEYSAEKIEAEMERILIDFKDVLEKYVS